MNTKFIFVKFLHDTVKCNEERIDNMNYVYMLSNGILFMSGLIKMVKSMS